MDTQLQEARRKALADSTEENMLKVFRLEQKQGLHPFKDSEDTFKEQLRRDEKRKRKDEQMQRAIDALTTALGDCVGSFYLRLAVADDEHPIKPYALYSGTGPNIYVHTITYHDESIKVQVKLSNGGDRVIVESSTTDADFPGKIPEKINAAITLYG